MSVTPADDAQDIAPASPITITFSVPMQRATTQDAVRILPRVDGTFGWTNDQTLTFTPRTTLPISKTIAVQISADARSIVQRALEQDVRTRFNTIAYPYVVDTSLALDAQFAYVPKRLTLTFNRALQPEGVRDHLTITPALTNERVTVQDQTIQLEGFFQPHTHYEIRLDRDLADVAYNLPLERALTWSFTATEQYPLLSVVNRTRVLPDTKKIQVPLQYTNVSRLDLAVYALTPDEFETLAAAPFETWYAFEPARAPVQRTRVETNARADMYTQQTLTLDALPAGNYFLTVTAPEGVGDTQLVRIQ